MTDITQEDEGLDLFLEEMASLETVPEGLEDLDVKVDQLFHTAIAIEKFGISPSTIGTIQATGLMNGTALSSIAAESFSKDTPDGMESQFAFEAVAAEMKEKSASWGAKILTFVKNSTSKIVSAISGVWTKLSGLIKKLGSKSLDAAKSVGRTAKAHPFATVLTVVAAAAAVAGVILLVSGGIPPLGATKEVLKAFMERVAAKMNTIKSSLWKVTTKVTESELVTTIDPVSTTEHVAEATAGASWTMSAVNAISAKLGKALKDIKDGAVLLSNKIYGVMESFNKAGDELGTIFKERTEKFTGSKLAGWFASKTAKKIYWTVVMSVVGSCWRLIKSIVMKAVQMVAVVFHKLSGNQA